MYQPTLGYHMQSEENVYEYIRNVVLVILTCLSRFEGLCFPYSPVKTAIKSHLLLLDKENVKMSLAG